MVLLTRKITNGVAKIKLGLEDKIILGNLDAKRDWSYAPDYVEGMWKILQASKPDDYVLATGKAHSIKEFLAEAFAYIGIEDWESYVVSDSQYLRPAEVDVLRGDYTKAKEELNWEPKTPFNEMIKRMVENDLKLLS